MLTQSDSSTFFRDAEARGIDALWLSWGIGLANFVFVATLDRCRESLLTCVSSFGLPAYWLIDRCTYPFSIHAACSRLIEASRTDGRRFLLLATTPFLALTMLAAGLSFNIPVEKTAHVGVISFWIFLFFIFYSVSVDALPRN